MAPLEEPLIPARVQAILDELKESTSQAINKLWVKYQAGDYPAVSATDSESHLEIVTGCDLLVNRPRDGITDEIYDLEVMNFGAKDRIGNNFMGYAAYHKCIAFRGEIRHMSTFLDFAYALLRDSAAEPVLKRGSEVKFPSQGLINGLNYDKFAARVEIVELAFYLSEDQHAEDHDAGESNITILSVSRDGQQLVAPSTEDAQYDADVSLESAESARVSNDTVVNPSAEHPAPNYEHDNGQEVVRTPIPAAEDLPRIEVHPPSTGCPDTEYLRPTSWSPLTNPDEEEYAPEVELTDVAVANNNAEMEASVNPAGDEHNSAPTEINDLENASDLMQQIVTLRQREEPQDPVEGEGEEDQLMTDGSLFGGTPEHDNEDENNLSIQEPAATSLEVLQKQPANGDRAVHDTPGDKGDTGYNLTASEAVAKPNDNPLVDNAISIPTTEPALAGLKIVQATNEATIREVLDSREDALGVDVPIPHGQSGEKYQQAVHALQSATIDEPTQHAHTLKRLSATHCHPEAVRESGLVSEKSVQSNGVQSQIAQVSKVKAPIDTSAVQTNETALSAMELSGAQDYGNHSHKSHLQNDKQPQPAQQAPAAECYVTFPDKPLHDQSLVQNSHYPPAENASAFMIATEGTEVMGEPRHMRAPINGGVGEQKDLATPNLQSHLPSPEVKVDLVGRGAKKEKISGDQRVDPKHDGMQSTLPSSGTDKAEEQHSGLDVLATAAASESDLGARMIPNTTENSSTTTGALNGATMGSGPLDAVRSAHGHQQSGPSAAHGADWVQNNCDAAGRECSGYAPVAVFHEPIGYAVQNISTAVPQHTSPDINHDGASQSATHNTTKESYPSQSRALKNSQPKMVSPLAPSEDGTDPLALSDDERATTTQHPNARQVSYEADAALAARLAAEARRYPKRKWSNTQDATPPPAKKQVVQAAPRKKLPQSKPGAYEYVALQTPLTKTAPAKAQTEKVPKTKKLKTFREGTRKMPRRSDAAVKYN